MYYSYVLSVVKSSGFSGYEQLFYDLLYGKILGNTALR